MTFEKILKGAGVAISIAILVVVLVKIHKPGAAEPHGSRSDVPPLEYAYLDVRRVDAYLGQDLNGLAATEERTDQISRTLKASVNPGLGASAEVGSERQHKTIATVSPNAADHFFTFLGLLREHGEAHSSNPASCNGSGRDHWLGEVNEDWTPRRVMQEINCIGVGNFVRISNAQLFLPPFAQVLPRVQSTTVFYGALPALRTSFTSPTQLASDTFRASLAQYVKLAGADPRMPFVAAPFGAKGELGGKGEKGRSVTFFLPAEFLGLTSEPSLFSGSVTVVGKIVYAAAQGAPYIDYPTVATFGRALLKAPKAFRTSLGVCSSKPPVSTLSGAPPKQTVATGTATRASAELPPLGGQLVHHARRRAVRNCTNNQQMIFDVKKSVRFAPPLVVVLPLAIYQ
jgi:hypothetical protein